MRAKTRPGGGLSVPSSFSRWLLRVQARISSVFSFFPAPLRVSSKNDMYVKARCKARAACASIMHTAWWCVGPLAFGRFLKRPRADFYDRVTTAPRPFSSTLPPPCERAARAGCSMGPQQYSGGQRLATSNRSHLASGCPNARWSESLGPPPAACVPLPDRGDGEKCAPPSVLQPYDSTARDTMHTAHENCARSEILGSG
jgi:hypothetical protein